MAACRGSVLEVACLGAVAFLLPACLPVCLPACFACRPPCVHPVHATCAPNLVRCRRLDGTGVRGSVPPEWCHAPFLQSREGGAGVLYM